MILVRYADWPDRLTRFLESCRPRKFRYGSHDCCLFAADAVRAITGADIAAEFRGKYCNRKEALLLARSYSGQSSIRALIERALVDFPSVNPSFAQRGDLVLIQRRSDYSLGIVGLNGRDILKPAEIGLASLSFTSAVKAWHV